MAHKLQPAEHKVVVPFQHVDAAEDLGCIEFIRQPHGDAQTVILMKGDLVLQATSERIQRHDCDPERIESAAKPRGS